jgi:hypothetical protein
MFPMRALLATAIAVLLSVCYALGSTNFSGNWVIDLHSSGSSDSMLKRLDKTEAGRYDKARIELYSIAEFINHSHARSGAEVRGRFALCLTWF